MTTIMVNLTDPPSKKEGMPPTYSMNPQPTYYHDPRFVLGFLLGLTTGITITRVLYNR
jgi:hypothetical protein